MFILSQCILHKCNAFSKLETISTYSIIVGLIFYASIYLYILFYNVEYISIFNKFIIYIVGIDLLLSTFYYSMNTPTVEQDTTTIPLLQENVEESQSDSESEDFFESAHEIEEDEDEIDDEEEIANEEIANEEIANEEIANEEILKEEIANEEIANEEIANEEIVKEEIVIGEMEKFDFKGVNLQQTMVDDIVIEIPEEIIVKKKKKGGRPSKKNLNIN